MARRALRVLLASGPTREPLDPVRFLSNYSTGYLGQCVAKEALRRGHQVRVVSGPVSLLLPSRARVVWVEQAVQMQRALRRWLRWADVVIMAAAVCDFQPASRRMRKLPRQGRLRVSLKATPDIIGSLPRVPGQIRVGFALETSHAAAHAASKLRRKRLDLIVGERINGRSPFGAAPVQAFFLRPDGARRELGRIAKPRLAHAILDEAERLWYGGKKP
jgi:phosphopantothenoylcysteine decarboxylase/phosphopantothenate--cysteine ligase